jgi:hypothetical protein
VLANVAGEAVGFGGAALLGAGAAALTEGLTGVSYAGAALLAILAVGAVEGSCVGLAQWFVLRGPLPAVRLRAWLLATVCGAVAAWGVGMAVGTRMGDGAAGAGPPVGVMLLGGAAIGAAAGVILAVPQWLVLRRAVRRAGWWVPAHALAWSAGMLVAFAGTALVEEGTPVPMVATVGAATGLAMGALVAAGTGVALVVLVRRPRSAADG